MKALFKPSLSDQERAEALSFWAESPARSYLQDPDWPDFAPRSNRLHTYHYAIVRGADGALVLFGVLRCTTLYAGYSMGAFRRGPVCRSVEDLQPALAALLPVLGRAGVISLTLNPRWEDEVADRAEAIIAGLGGRLVPPERQSLHALTGLVELGQPFEERLATFSRSVKGGFKKLDKLGLTVRPAEGEGDLALYAEMLDKTRAALELAVEGQPDARAQRDFVAKKGGLFIMVEKDDQPVGAFVLFRDGPRLMPIADGWAEMSNAIPRGNLVLGSALRAGTEALDGVRWLDIGGLTDPETAENERGAGGRDKFKMGFGPRVVRLPKIHEIVLRPILHAAVAQVQALRRWRKARGKR